MDWQIGQKLKEARTRLHLTQAQVAELVGLSEKHYQNIENDRHNPSLESLAKIAKVLEVSLDNLLYNKQVETPFTEELRQAVNNLEPDEQKMILKFILFYKENKGDHDDALGSA